MFTEAEQHCPVHITHCKKDYHEDGEHIDQHIYKIVCALLNSGGGVLILENKDYKKAKPKDLDIFFQRHDDKFKSIIDPSSYGDVFDRIGECTDENILLFVKAPGHVCTVNSHLYLASDSSVTKASFKQAQELLSKGTEQEPTIAALENLPTFDDNKFQHGKFLTFHESKQIQFKHFQSNQPLENKDHEEGFGRCVSAFANGDGGEIFIGIKDDCEVLGQIVPDQKIFEEKLCSLLDLMCWGSVPFKPVKGIHWDVKFFPVKNSPDAQSFVIVVYIAGMQNCGGVFYRLPESYYIQFDGNEKLCSLDFEEWIKLSLADVEKQEKLREQLQKFKRNHVPGKVLLSVGDAVEDIREEFFKVTEGCPVSPEGFEKSLPEEAQKFIKRIQDKYKYSNGLLVASHSWITRLSECKPVGNVICDLLLISRDARGLQLITLYSDDEQEVIKYSKSAAQTLKRNLVINGAYTEKFYVSSVVVTCDETDLEPEMEFQYPQVYNLDDNKINKILEAMVKVLARVPSTLSSKMGVKFMNLLTKQQFQLVHQQIDINKVLWIKGVAGSGKTLVAVEFMRELLRRDEGLTKEEILYVCENRGLRNQIRSADVCRAECRATFVKNDFVPTVKHVIMDEVQNYRDEKGTDEDDWYAKANRLVKQKCPSSPGHLWFFTDDSQANHKFPTGLPLLENQIPRFRLNTVIRNSKEIFSFVQILRSENDIQLGHDYEGEKVLQKRYQPSTPSSQLNAVKGILQNLLEEGYLLKEIAILYAKDGCIPENLEHALEVTPAGAESNSSEDLVVSTVLKYSGLDRPVVVLVDVSESIPLGRFRKSFLYCAMTRALVKLVILRGERVAPKNR